ncbi:MAG: amino acid adenylation domain-containing protein, partial [Gemmatimonadetes bacterium]|nr:amino acid adenylation domain-containing protein [Gemmatimonadota bacterium]
MMENVEGVYPLSPTQLDILLRTLEAPDLHEYVEQIHWRLRGSYDPRAFREAWRRVMARHPALRMAFFHEGLDEPVQVVRREVEPEVAEEDWRGTSEGEVEARFRALLAGERRRDFALASAPLTRVRVARVAHDRYLFAWSYHHLLMDGWSAQLCLREMLETYHALAAGEVPRAGPVAPYSRYLAWLAAQDRAGAERYWRRALAGMEPPEPFPVRLVGADDGGTYAVQTATLPAETCEALRWTARRLQVTLATLFEGAWGVLLARCTGVPEVIFGSVDAGRPTDLPGAEGMLGLLMRTVPVRVVDEPAARVADWLEALQRTHREARLHGSVPLGRIREWSGLLPGDRLLDHLLLFQNLPDTGVAHAAIGGAELSGFERVPPDGAYGHRLMLTVVPGREIALELTHPAWLCPDAARALLGHLRTLLEAMATDPERPLSTLALVTPEERRCLVAEWNATEALPPAACVHTLFEAQVGRTPDRVALVSGDETLTYAELDARADRLAHRLAARGVGPESRVGVCLERTAEMVVAVLGVLKAGAAYVPLDPAHPAERLAYVLEDSGAGLVLTGGRTADALPADVPRLVLDAEAPPSSAPDPAPRWDTDPASLAYVLYTSGSTGRPKGVLVEHRSLVAFLHAMRRRPGMGADDVLLAVTTLGFDIAGLEIFLPLTSGARVVLADRATAADPALLARALDESGATVLQATPATWRMLLDAGWEGSATLTALCGGEALPEELSGRLRPRVRALWNLYGPTETTVWSTTHRVAEGGAPPIGEPVDGTRAYVLDWHGNPVPVGVPGELHIGGAGVARGYHRRPELTADRFLPDPFAAGPGARAYRTGDRVRRRPDGTLEFLGRADQQVKVRGFRIEPGEIEAALRAHPGVREAVVGVREDASGDRRLVGYVVPAPGVTTSAAELRGHLAARLPDYMVPGAIVTLDALPLTPSGKVDRRALPAPDPLPGSDADAAPRTPTEEIVAGIFAGVLRLERVGAHDDFFALGGHSLLATQAATRVRAAFGTELPQRVFFQRPTVAGLAAWLDARRDAPERAIAPIEHVAEPGAWLPLSPAQQRLWLAHRMDPASRVYNQALALRLAGRLNAGALARALTEVARRHAVFRTRFVEREGVPGQVIEPPREVPLPLVDLSGLAGRANTLEAVVRERTRELFDLRSGVLLRALLARLSEDEHALVVTMHHVTNDGWSAGILFHEVVELYRAFAAGRPSPLPEPPVQYADYAVWQRKWLTPERERAQLDFWRRQLDGLPELRLATDGARTTERTDGATRAFALSGELSGGVRRLGRSIGATPFMVLLAAFEVLLRWQGWNDEVVVGTDVASRNLRSETEGVVGFFLNRLVLRTRMDGNPSFAELVGRVRDVALAAYDHQDVPFDRVVEALRPRRAAGGTPFFRVGFLLQNFPAPRAAELPGLVLEPFPAGPVEAQLDLRLAVQDDGAGMSGTFEYRTHLFSPELVGHWTRRFVEVLEAAVADPGRRLAELDALLDVGMRGEGEAAGRAHWARQSEGPEPRLWVERDDPVETTTAAVRGELPAEVAGALAGSAGRTRAPAGAVLLAAWKALLHRLGAGGIVRVGVSVDGRVDGHLPVATRVEAELSFASLVERMRDALEDSAAWRSCFDGERLRASGYAPLRVGFTVVQEPEVCVEEDPFALHLRVGPGPALALVGGETFSQAQLALLLERYTTLLADALARPEVPVGGLAVMSGAERRRVLEEFGGGGTRPGSEPGTVLAWIDAQAARTPSAPAVRSGAVTVAYGELNARANRRARHLRTLGVGPETRVGIMLPPSPERVESLLAVLKAGGAYLPLDPEYPRERLAFMVRDAALPLVLTTASLRGRVPTEAGTAVVAWDEVEEAVAAYPDGDLGSPPDPASAAYLIYTSGSTGTPRGVVVEHRALAAHALAVRAHYGLGEGDRVLQFASFNFDASVEQMLPPLAAGACVVLRGEAVPGVEALARYVDDGVTVLNLPTAQWHLLADAWARGEGLPDASGVRLVIAGGEAMLPHHAGLWRKTPAGGARLLNAYGPTEAVVTATTFEVPAGFPAEARARVPIGRPFGERSAYVLDGALEPVLVGVPGELYLGGVALARGYLGRPELTADRFVPDPFGRTPGARLYRTGDRVRHAEDGTLVFLGRADDQVKVRGFRIEPGEVEAVLGRHPEVRECAVGAEEQQDGARRLVAYWVPRREPPADPAALRAFLREHLPDHMVPGVFVALEAIPLTPAGKVDRRRLPEQRPIETERPVVAPSTPAEERVAAVWAEVMRQERV